MRDYDRQIILHINLEDQLTPKVKWDRFRDPALNDNINMWDHDSKLANRHKLNPLTNQSRVYIVAHGIPPKLDAKDREYVYLDKNNRIHSDFFADYIGDNARHPSLKFMNDRVLRVSLVVCFASLGRFPAMLHQRLKDKYGIFSEVIARADEVMFNPTQGIKYARRSGRNLEGKAPKEIYRFLADSSAKGGFKQVKGAVDQSQPEHQDWNLEAVALMGSITSKSRPGSMPEFDSVLAENTSNADRFHLKYANDQLVAAMKAILERAPRNPGTEATIKRLEDMIESCPAR